MTILYALEEFSHGQSMHTSCKVTLQFREAAKNLQATHFHMGNENVFFSVYTLRVGAFHHGGWAPALSFGTYVRIPLIGYLYKEV